MELCRQRPNIYCKAGTVSEISGPGRAQAFRHQVGLGLPKFVSKSKPVGLLEVTPKNAVVIELVKLFSKPAGLGASWARA